VGRPAREVRDGVQRQLDASFESRRRVWLVLIDTCIRVGLSRGRITEMLGVTGQRVTVLTKDLGCADTGDPIPTSED
jgi:hypothetical protein